MELSKDDEMQREEPVSPEETKQVQEELEPESEPVNGHLLDDDDNNNEELSPPPDSLAEETMSQTTSSPLLNILEDEIVVGTNANRAKSSPLPPLDDDQEDLDMEEIDDDQPMIPQYAKRKRNSGYNDSVENSAGSPSPIPNNDAAIRPRLNRPIKGPSIPGSHGMGGVKGVILGYWRESPVPDPQDKHAVIGFIDVRDRLRTRIQPTTRDGRSIVHEFPLPPGPGGSWVTFDKVAFDEHLINLDHYQVKEFVKVRVETSLTGETPEQRVELDEAAVKEAIRRIQSNPPPESTAPVAIAYGPIIPEHAHLPHRPDKRRKTNLVPDGTSSRALLPNAGVPLMDNLSGTRPTRILLGCWKLSSEASRDNKHAVYGILGANDMFRVKLVRETRDGRPQNGNFPAGPGALWIHWDQVDFEDHLKELSRVEIKEYCRVRQYQLDEGESPHDREENQKLAVVQAKQRVAAGFVARKDDAVVVPQQASPALNGNDYDDLQDVGAQEARPSRRTDLAQRVRHSLPGEADLRAGGRIQKVEALERTNSIARREIARVEAAQMRADQRAAASREASAAPVSNKSLFQDSVSRLNKVWAAQEANRLKAGAEDAKMYMGVKYERKQSGPFQGKLVSQGTIISIDGEDYVEYRVLTKPTFF